MLYYKPVQVIIDTQKLAKIILDIVIWHHDLPNLIVANRRSPFISKFWFSFYYYFSIKQKLSTDFHP